MRLLFEATEDYGEVGGLVSVEKMVGAAFAHVPREHLRQLDGIYALDVDPKGARLGVYVRDHLGPRIELFLHPHALDVARVPEASRASSFQLHVAHTLFHEVGHHLTLTLNPRREPSKKRGVVTETLEKWAEQYTEKRMAKFRAALAAQT